MDLCLSPETGELLPVCAVSYMLCIAEHGVDIRYALDTAQFIKFPDDAFRVVPKNYTFNFRDILCRACELHPNGVDLFLYPLAMSHNHPLYSELIFLGTFELKDFILDLDVQEKASAKSEVSDE